MPSDYELPLYESKFGYSPSDPFWDLKREEQASNFDYQYGNSIDEKIINQVTDTLGIERLEDVISFEIGEYAPQGLRGTRFNSVAEALVFLFDAGILNFSAVYVSKDEIQQWTDTCSGDPDCIARFRQAYLDYKRGRK